MKVAKWDEAPTGTFIKLSAKTGKISVNVIVFTDVRLAALCIFSSYDSVVC